MEITLPAVAGVSGVLATGVVLYTKLRPYFPVRVNCWFCNSNTTVPYRRKDTFVCPSCKQYNGFDQDGDYNCDMPAQYCESLNSPSSSRRVAQSRHNTDNSSSVTSTAGLSLGNGLCQTCNLQQAMKVKALTDFVPSHPDHYDEEIEVYEKRMERLYGGLCGVCSQTLSSTLTEQDSWLKPKLIHWRLQQSRLIKNLLTPLHRGLGRRPRLLVSAVLRLACILACLSLLLSCAVNSLHDDLSEQQQQTNTTARMQHYSLQLLEVLSSSWPGHQQYSRAVCQHEAGVVLVLLALLLAAVAVAGQAMLKVWDACGCLLLVALLAVCSWQHSELLITSFQPLHLLYAKGCACVLVCVAVAAGLTSAAPPPLQRHRRRQTIRGSRAADTSQDSQLTNDSLNSSYGCDSPRMSHEQLIATTAAADALLSTAPQTDSSEPHNIITSAPHNTTSTPLVSPPSSRYGANRSQLSNPFLAQNAVSSSSLSGHNMSSVVTPSKTHGTGLANGFLASSSKPTLRSSYSSGESPLDTSLGCLQIGTPKRGQQQQSVLANVSAARNSFMEQSRLQNNRLRPRAANNLQQPLQSPRVFPNNIAQSSWVAGGYWGSPTKSSRAPPTVGVPQASHRHLRDDRDEMVFPVSRASSQSSGFVSHASGSQGPIGVGIVPRGGGGGGGGYDAADRLSVASEPAFVWNYESCETSSLSSQDIDAAGASQAAGGLRRRQNNNSVDIASYSSVVGENFSDVRSLTSCDRPPSQYSSAAGTTSSLLSQHQEQMLHLQTAMLALNSTMSQQRNLSSCSDEGLSIVSLKRRLDDSGVVQGGAAGRSSWVAFVLGMSVMANGFLGLVLYKNGTLAELLD